MRRPIFSLLLCLLVVFGVITLGANQSSQTASLPAPALRFNPDAVGARTAHAVAESSTLSDTTNLNCPVDPKRGTATIRIDSTRKRWRLTVKPDSQLKEMTRPPDWESVTLVSHGDLNQDGLRDLVVEYSYQGTQPVHPDRHGVYVGCGNDRYTPVTTDVSLEPDSLDRKLDVAKPWPDLTVLGDIKTNERTKDPNYYYHLTYRFEEEEGQYRPVPGSARYKKDSAQRLGIDLVDRPECTIGKGPPIRIRPVEGVQTPLQPGDSVRIKPTYDPELSYGIEWRGNLNPDGRRDLIVEMGCAMGACRYRAYISCRDDSGWRSMVFESDYVDEIRVIDSRGERGWAAVRVKAGVKKSVVRIKPSEYSQE